jgi:hypothetical protein
MPDTSLEKIEARLEDLEKTLEALKPKKKDNWDRAQVFFGILTPLITFFFGLWFVSLVNIGLDRQKFRVSSVKDMQGLLNEIRDPATPVELAQTAAISLAAFGPPSITPLLNVVQTGEANLVIAGETGLRAVGMSDGKETCDRMIEVLDSRSQLYSWFTQRTALRVIGDLACCKARHVVDDYAGVLAASGTREGLDDFRRWVRADPAPTPESVELLRTDSTRTQEILRRSGGTR